MCSRENCSIFAVAILAKSYFILVVAIWVTHHTHGLSHGSPLPETAQSVLFQNDNAASFYKCVASVTLIANLKWFYFRVVNELAAILKATTVSVTA